MIIDLSNTDVSAIRDILIDLEKSVNSLRKDISLLRQIDEEEIDIIRKEFKNAVNSIQRLIESPSKGNL